MRREHYDSSFLMNQNQNTDRVNFNEEKTQNKKHLFTTTIHIQFTLRIYYRK